MDIDRYKSNRYHIIPITTNIERYIDIDIDIDRYLIDIMITIQTGTCNHLNLAFSYHFGWFQALLLESRGRRIRHRILEIEELSVFLTLIAGCRLPSYSPVL